jgi:hypothetical protein
MKSAGRPSSEVIFSHEDDSGTIWEITETVRNCYFIVTYKGNPCNIRTLNVMAQGYSYKRMSFSNPGNAHARALSFNQIFKCEDFKVVQIDGF